MNSTPTFLYVRNLEQAAAMMELDGQISDGMWENARPLEHWHPWCDATVVVAEGDQKLGRTFNARKDNYNLTSPELMKYVGLRMLGTIRIARRFGLAVAQKLEFLTDTDGKVGVFETWNEQNLIAALAIFNAENEVLVTDLETFKSFLLTATTNQSYTMKMMLADLRDLKAIFRTRLW